MFFMNTHMGCMFYKIVTDDFDLSLEEKIEYAVREAKDIKVLKDLGNTPEQATEKFFLDILEVQLIYIMDDKGLINWSIAKFLVNEDT